MMTIVLGPGDSWQGISEGTIIQVEFKMSSCHLWMSRIVSSTAASMPDWYSELGSFAGFRLITSLHTLLTDDKLPTLEILNRCCAKRCLSRVLPTAT